jgi:hypothetical protein
MATPKRVSDTVHKLQERIARLWAREIMSLLERRLTEAADDFGALGDLSSDDLAAMGHPYGRGKPRDTPYDDRLIHEQSGELHRAFYTMSNKDLNGITVALKVNVMQAPYWEGLKYGTSRMRKRDLGSRVDDHFMQTIWPELVSHLKSSFSRAVRESRA